MRMDINKDEFLIEIEEPEIEKDVICNLSLSRQQIFCFFSTTLLFMFSLVIFFAKNLDF